VNTSRRYYKPARPPHPSQSRTVLAFVVSSPTSPPTCNNHYLTCSTMYKLNLTTLVLVFILALSVAAASPRGLRQARIMRRNGGDKYGDSELGNKDKPLET